MSKAAKVLDPKVGEHIRDRRKASGMSLSFLAGRIGVSAATLSQIENGRTAVTHQRLRELGRHVDLDFGLMGVPAEATVVGASPPDWRQYAPVALDPVAETALRLFVEKGYHGTSIRDIAGSLGRSISGIYHRHASKQEVLAYLMDLTMAELLSRIDRARDDGEDPAERFALMVESLALYHMHRQDLAFLGATEMRALEPEARKRVEKLRRQTQLLFDDEVDNACAAGVFRPANPRHAARSVTYMCISIARWYRPQGVMQPHVIAAENVSFALSIMKG